MVASRYAMARKKPEESPEGTAADTPGGTSRARGKPKRAKPTVSPDERVDQIVQLMASGRYDGAATRFELAAKWGVTEATVRHATAEAHRRLKADPEETERLKLSLAQYCAEMKRAAATDRNLTTGLLDINGGIKAAEAQAKFMGIELEPKRIELTGKGGTPLAPPQIVVKVLKPGKT